jgi:hypothetical protein
VQSDTWRWSVITGPGWFSPMLDSEHFPGVRSISIEVAYCSDDVADLCLSAYINGMPWQRSCAQ